MDPWQRHVRDGRTASSIHTRSTDLSAGSRSARATAGEVPKDGGDMADIYKELQDINDKMKVGAFSFTILCYSILFRVDLIFTLNQCLFQNIETSH